MKTNNKNNAFTLIEMVGVLAVIAILAALLVPKIFAAINDSRFSNTVASINSCKTATMDYFGKTGSIPLDGAFDTTLVSSNCLERPLACKIATSSLIQVTNVAKGGPGTGAAYQLDGSTAITGGVVVQCKLTGVALADAKELSRRIDGEGTLSPTGGTDALGRVVYGAAETDGSYNVFVYIAHK